MILISGLGVFCIIYAFIGLLILFVELKVGSKSEKIDAVIDIYMLPFIMLGVPIYIIIKSIGVLVGFNKYKRDCFTIHDLTAKNKTTLKEMGFEYGEFISVNNINYKGYRYKRGLIVVLPNGRVNYSVKLEDEDKVLLNIVKCLPSE